MFKTEKGITLVALVITIIVMLILAGVSISLVLDEDNGLIRKSQTSVKAYQDADAAEQAKLNEMERKLDSLIEVVTGEHPENVTNYSQTQMKPVSSPSPSPTATTGT